MTKRNKKTDKIEFEAPKFTIADIIGTKISVDNTSNAQKHDETETPVGNPAGVDLSAPIRLSIKKKGYGGKTVTLVSGVGGGQEAIGEFVKKLKKSLGCGADVSDDGIIVQGDQRERLLPCLKAMGAKNVK